MKIRWIHFLLLNLLAFACAKQTSPTGGPTDETPPALVSSTPRHKQINVTRAVLELQFDEAIQLNNPREQIIITPSTGKKFETTFNKRKVTLDLKAELSENTTYNINFREAIQDLTEKNPATVKLAFSTGSYIDSLSINGKVLDALTEKTQGNYTVALAEASDTFNIFKHPASWITITDKKGFFSIENLKPGTYFLYAFDDRSKNLLVDSKSEKYGFISEPISLTKNLDSLKIKTFKFDANPLKLITARTTFAYFNLRFSKSLVEFNLQAVDTSHAVYGSLEKDLTTIKIYNTIPTLDSLQIRVHATDSLNFSVDTLLYIKFPKKEATHDKLEVKFETPKIFESNPALTAQVDFNKPIMQFNPDSMFLKIDSITRLSFIEKEYSWDTNLSRLILSKAVDLATLFPTDTSTVNESATKPVRGRPSKKEVTLIFLKGTFISIENDTVKQLDSPVSLIKTESTASIETKVETKENFIIQIITKAEKIIAQRVNEKESTFENLPPETYLIRLMIDLNKNGKWDPGNIATRTEPEPIRYYRNSKQWKEIPLKANWTVGPLLITY